MSTIYDVAERAGVSAMTVSRVLNKSKSGGISVSEKTREKVMRVAKEIGYSTDLLAQGLRKGRSGQVGLIIPSARFSYLSEVIEGIEEKLRSRQASLTLCPVSNKPELEEAYFEMLYSKKVDGVIVWSNSEDEKLRIQIDRFAAKGKAVVMIYRPKPVPGTCNISIDFTEGGRLAAKHLIERGRKRVATRLTRPEEGSVHLMTEGFKDACREHGFEIEKELLFKMNSYQAGAAAAQKIAAMKNPPDGVFTTGDYQAFGLIKEAKCLGLNVPTDLAVVGHNDIEFAAMCDPGLTTIYSPKKEIGSLAAQYVYKKLEREETPNVVLQPKLVVRESA